MGAQQSKQIDEANYKTVGEFQKVMNKEYEKWYSDKRASIKGHRATLNKWCDNTSDSFKGQCSQSSTEFVDCLSNVNEMDYNSTKYNFSLCYKESYANNDK